MKLERLVYLHSTQIHTKIHLKCATYNLLCLFRLDYVYLKLEFFFVWHAPGNYDWYSLGRGGNGCDRKTNATILPLWKHREFDKPNGDNWPAGTNKCQRGNIQVSTNVILFIYSFGVSWFTNTKKLKFDSNFYGEHFQWLWIICHLIKYINNFDLIPFLINCMKMITK